MESQIAQSEADLEKSVVNQVSSIIKSEDQVIGKREILNPLKLAIISSADIRVIVDIVASDPALAAHMLYRNSLTNIANLSKKKNRSLKDTLVRIGMVNVYRYAFTFYLKEKFDSLNEPYKKLINGYWNVNEEIALDSMIYIREMNDNGKLLHVDKNELQTLALFSIFGEIVALTAFAYINMNTDTKIPIKMVKRILDGNAKKFSIMAFDSLGIDDDLAKDFMVAHNLASTSNPDSIGLIIRAILSKRKLLLSMPR